MKHADSDAWFSLEKKTVQDDDESMDDVVSLAILVKRGTAVHLKDIITK